MTEPAITPELVKKHNLTPEEYEKILGIIGRAPSYTELGIFSVMWSEHCSYKNTRPLLKGFPTESPLILVRALTNVPRKVSNFKKYLRQTNDFLLICYSLTKNTHYHVRKSLH